MYGILLFVDQLYDLLLFVDQLENKNISNLIIFCYLYVLINFVIVSHEFVIGVGNMAFLHP
jgi:hypothetical protein